MPRPKSKFFVRHIIPSDSHAFVGRIYDLSIISMHFDAYEDLAKYPDCKYAFDTNEVLTNLTRRVESLNLAGGMLWLEPLPNDLKSFPVSAYEWLTISADVFLMRYVSVVDCLLLLINVVYEADLTSRKCTLENLRKRIGPTPVLTVVEEMLSAQGDLRDERNSRFHHGEERGFTQDDLTFRTISMFVHRGNGMTGTDRFGRKFVLERSFKEGLVGLQRDFNSVTRKLVRDLNKAYSALAEEFESRFVPRIRAATHGLNVRRREV